MRSMVFVWYWLIVLAVSIAATFPFALAIVWGVENPVVSFLLFLAVTLPLWMSILAVLIIQSSQT